MNQINIILFLINYNASKKCYWKNLQKLITLKKNSNMFKFNPGLQIVKKLKQYNKSHRVRWIHEWHTRIKNLENQQISNLSDKI